MGEGTHRIGDGEPQLLVDLVATDPAEVVALGIKEAGLPYHFTWLTALSTFFPTILFR